MAQITLKGNPINTAGELPTVGSTAPAFTLVAGDLSEVTLSDYAGKTIVVNIVPSFDTGICAASVKEFNQRAAEANCTIVNVSADLPFAQKRFCEAEGVDNVVNLSNFRCSEFGKDYGITITDGPMKGLLGRAVVVINGDHEIVYTELVPEIVQEPNYDAAMGAISQTA